MGIAALVLGIVGVLFSFIPGISVIGILLGILALILGVVGRKSAQTNNLPTGTATAGLVLGVVALVLSIVIWVTCAFMMKKALKEGLNNPEFQRRLNDPNMNKEFDDAFKKAMEEAAKNQK